MHTTAALEAANLADATTITKRIRALADRYDNADDYAAGLAVAAYAAGLPAYWSSSRGYSNAPAGILLRYVNDEPSVALAVGAIEHDNPYSHHDYRSARLLDDLLPLNWAAVIDLEAAYRRLAHTFVSVEELHRRTERAESERPVDELAQKAVEHHTPGAALVEA